MKLPAISSVHAALLLTAAVLCRADASGKVQDLTHENFDAVVGGEAPVMVKFYAPWCGHCKAMAPEYEKAAKELENDTAVLAKVDCTVEKELCEKHDVAGFPTVKFFHQDKAKEYEGGRTSEAIVSYIRKAQLPPLSDVAHDNLDTFKDSDRVVVMGYFDSNDAAERAALETVAKELRDKIVFGSAVDPESHAAHGVKTPALRVYKKFDEGMAEFSGEFTAEEITAFVRAHEIPLIDEIGPDNFMKYVDTGLPIAYIFVADDDTRKTIPELLKPVAREFKSKVNMVWIDADKYSGHAEALNLKPTWPAFAIQEPESQTKFPFPQDKEITEESIRAFVDNYVKGEVQPSIKSEPIPEKNDDPVKVVVADEFDKIVMDKERDVLIEFYAPWCGHCKSLAPTYDLVGAKYIAHSDKVVIAKMDATANDVPPSSGIVVTGFPTIKLVKAGTNEVVEYSGDRSEASFYKFIKENGTHQIDAEAVVEADEEKTAKKDEADQEKTTEETLLKEEAEKAEKRDEL